MDLAGSGKTVLIADADVDTRDLYRATFDATQWEVCDASDGRDALVHALTRPPALLITELRLPIIDGFELCAELRHDPHTERLPILVVTAETRSEHHVRARCVGATAVLVKPVPMDTLLFSASRLIEEGQEGRWTPARTEELRAHAVFEQARADELVAETRNPITRVRTRAPRDSTTTPPSLSLFCPNCTGALTYVLSHFGGVKAEPERWDQFECARCAVRFEYRARTRRLRRVA